MKKLKIISAYSELYRNVGTLSAQSIEYYATHFGHDFEISRFNNDSHQGWDKIDLLLNELRKGTHEYIFWVDADAIFANFNKDIYKDVAEKNSNSHFWIANHLCTLKSLSGSKRPYGLFRFGRVGQVLGSLLMGRHIGIYLQIERPNAGIMLMKNSHWTIEFLEKVKIQGIGNNHPFGEQRAIHNLMGLYFEGSNGRRRNKLNMEIMEKVDWLSDEWNCVPLLMDISHGKKFYTQQANYPVIYHLAGMKNAERIVFMEDIIKNFKI